MGKPCQYVYRYNGNEKDQDIEPDLEGEVTIPVKGSIIQRRGKPWKVVHVSTETVLSPDPPIPVHRVMLTDNLELPIFP